VAGSSPAGARAAAQVFVEDLGAPEPSPDDARHLVAVLRLRPGETVVAADGAGSWRLCRITGTTQRDSGCAGLLEPDGPVHHEAPSYPEVTVAFVPAKGERPEWAVQKLTESGVDRIVVLGSSRAVVRWEGVRRDRALQRLARVAREAAAQSRRARLPEITEAPDLETLAGRLAPVRLALADPAGAPPDLGTPALAVGPEGGWDPAEVGRGWPLVRLGAGVLRAETAAVAAGVLLCGLRAGVVAPVEGAPLPPPGAPGPDGPCNHHAE